ncbi:MAG: hypothetical protein M1830_001404 [Pleopsidium flavum]|nr:MAG: hypothetical protein M1830_002371 [Pleopsidium flavum]KAI9872620.1 MAG: hypothetical protein M1830_001404 [Pleopsidium flavum]
MASKAVAFKEEGNKCFQAGDYKGAEALYTKAISKDPTNPFLFTNRAFSRIRLQSWEDCINDCLKAIDLLPSNMKAYYYLAQAQLALHHPNEALNSALTAYDLCLSSSNSSTRSVSELVLQVKREKWEVRERERLRTRNDMLGELEEKLEASKADDLEEISARIKAGFLSSTEAEDERNATEDSARRKSEELRSIFALADPENVQKRASNS